MMPREWPTVDEIVEQLKHAQKFTNFIEDLDVRLQVYENGAWVIRIGDAQYDQDHRGCWGAGSINADPDFDLRSVANDLLDQVQDMA